MHASIRWIVKGIVSQDFEIIFFKMRVILSIFLRFNNTKYWHIVKNHFGILLIIYLTLPYPGIWSVNFFFKLDFFFALNPTVQGNMEDYIINNSLKF